jgi:hypothetical protein
MTTAHLNTAYPATEWTVYQGKAFSVQVRAWRGQGSEVWKWNVYALIFDGHPLHQNVDAALGLHFHWGTSYDKRVVTSPARAGREWDKVSDCLKLGSDYGHHNDYYEECDPKDGIPPNIYHDAATLAQELLDRATGAA